MYRYVKRSSDLEEQAKEPAAVQALLVERRPVARVMSGGLESSLTNQLGFIYIPIFGGFFPYLY